MKPLAKRSVGKPRKFKTPKELERKINKYFASCFNEKGEQIRPFTMSGLAIGLGTTRETISKYRTEFGGEYADTIKAAVEKCQNYAEERLFGTGQVAGVIFNLKNNYGWVDKQELDVGSSSPVQYSIDELKELKELAMLRARQELKSLTQQKTLQISNE
jgi:hypothetical protein